MLLQYPDDLLFRIPALLHLSSLVQSTRELQLRLVEISGGRSYSCSDHLAHYRFWRASTASGRHLERPILGRTVPDPTHSHTRFAADALNN
jgi:hypothetical protein